MWPRLRITDFVVSPYSTQPVVSLVGFSAMPGGGMVSLKTQNEGSLKKTKALHHWLLMIGTLVSKISTTEQRTPSKQNKTKHKNDATFKVNVNELDIATSKLFSEYLTKGQTA